MIDPKLLMTLEITYVLDQRTFRCLLKNRLGKIKMKISVVLVAAAQAMPHSSVHQWILGNW